MDQITDKQFNNLMVHYQSTFIQWHYHLKKYIKIERDAFLTEFQLILFKAMRHFDISKATSENARFERYFMSSLRKMCNTLLRKHSSKKNKVQKQSSSFCLRKHDIIDPTIDYGHHQMIVDDILNRYLPKDERIMVRMMVSGYTASEICKSLKMDNPEYRSHLRRIRNNTDLVAAVSSI